MRKEQIEILVRLDRSQKEPSPQSVDAYTDPSFLGLAVHKGIEYARDLWYVTHVASGWAIHCLAFEKRKQAIAYAQIAATVADWTQSMEDLIDQRTDRKLIDAKAHTKAMAA